MKWNYRLNTELYVQTVVHIKVVHITMQVMRTNGRILDAVNHGYDYRDPFLWLSGTMVMSMVNHGYD